MSNSSLSSQLAAVTADQEQQRQLLQAQQEELRDQRHAVHQQLLTLQRQLDTLIQQQQTVAATAQAQEDQATRQKIALITGALEAGNTRLQAVMTAVDIVQRLTTQRAALLAAESNLAQDWQDYQEFEANREAALAVLPEGYREQLLALHAQKQQRLQPLLDLEAQIQQVETQAVTEVECLLYRNLDSADLSFVLPIRQVDVAGPGGESWQHLPDYIEEVLFQLGKLPDWQIVEIATGSWSGYISIDTLAEYNGSEPIEISCEQAFEQYFAAAANPTLLRLQLHVVPITGEIWTAGEHAATDQTADANVAEAAPSAIATVTAEETIEPVLSVDSWYTATDLKAWLQPVKVTADSKWSRLARQLRTLLLRLIGKGKIGHNWVLDQQLWQGLPASIGESLAERVQQMIDAELLLNTRSEDGSRLVSLNPALLDEVQSLINRTVTPLWEPIVATSQNQKP